MASGILSRNIGMDRAWSIVKSLDPGSTGNQFYAVTAVSGDNVYAVGQQAGTGFPGKALIERWDGSQWRIVYSPNFASATSLPLGVTTSAASLTIVGQKESDRIAYKTYVVSGSPDSLSVPTTPNLTHNENDLFGVTTDADWLNMGGRLGHLWKSFSRNPCADWYCITRTVYGRSPVQT